MPPGQTCSAPEFRGGSLARSCLPPPSRSQSWRPRVCSSPSRYSVCCLPSRSSSPIRRRKNAPPGSRGSPRRWRCVVLATAALAVGLYGLARLARRSAIGFALVFYAMILAVWPYPPDRFIWVVLPWLALTWTVGAVELWRRRPRVRIAIALLCALVVG